MSTIESQRPVTRDNPWPPAQAMPLPSVAGTRLPGEHTVSPPRTASTRGAVNWRIQAAAVALLILGVVGGAVARQVHTTSGPTRTSPTIATAPAKITVAGIVGGDWTVNGDAVKAGPRLTLTQAVQLQKGSAVFSTPVSSDALTVTFTSQIGGGDGADGLVFAMLDATQNTMESIGGNGGGLGFSGLPGVAVALDTHQGAPADPSPNFIGLSTGGSDPLSLNYVATTSSVPDLRGTHTVTVTALHGTVAVALDGAQVIAPTAINLPSTVLPAFTGANGGLSDEHAVTDISLLSSNVPIPQQASGWRFFGTAMLDGANLVLTPTQTGKAGAAFFSTPLHTVDLTASFNLSIGSGDGANGMTFALIDPKGMPSSLGVAQSGSILGFGGLPGVAVAFLTYPQGGIDSHNWVGLATSSAGGGEPQFVAHNINVQDLRSGSHKVTVHVTGTTIVVTIDGASVLNAKVPQLAATVLAGFTASTGSRTDLHMVSDINLVG